MAIELRGNIWTSPRFSDAAQRPALVAVGAKPIYADQFEGALKSLRKDNRLVVKDFRGVGRSRSEIEKNIDRVHAKGAVVMEAETGRLSTSKHRKALVDEAVKKLGDEKRGPQKHTKKDTPWDVVAVHYFNPLLSNAQFAERMGVSYHRAWRHFDKPRGAPVGRPSAARIAMNATV